MLGTLKWTRSMLSLVTNFLRFNKNRKLLQLKIQKRKMKIHFLDTNLNFPDKLKTQILEKSFNVQKNWELTLNFQSFLMRFSTHLISKVNFSSVLRQKYIWKPLTFILGKDCMKKPFLTIQRQRLKRNQNLLWLNFTIVFMLHKFSNQLEEMRFLFLSITKLKISSLSWAQSKELPDLILILAWGFVSIILRSFNMLYVVLKRLGLCMELALRYSQLITPFSRTILDVVWWCWTEIKRE